MHLDYRVGLQPIYNENLEISIYHGIYSSTQRMYSWTNARVVYFLPNCLKTIELIWPAPELAHALHPETIP